MTQPRVCAVMLVDGRPDMVARAIRSFEAQTYKNAYMLMYDTGTPPYDDFDILEHIETTREPDATVGSLRNIANTCARDADIIVHWDSDDWSAPERIAEQVADLTNTKLPIEGKSRSERLNLECVGYNDMIFWDCRISEAWEYSGSPHYMLGTSLCYWRDTWKRRPFPAKNSGEDTEWQIGLKSSSKSTRLPPYFKFGPHQPTWAEVMNEERLQEYSRKLQALFDEELRTAMLPRMIASIHGGNIASHVDQRSKQWQRVPEWDEYCRKVMA